MDDFLGDLTRTALAREPVPREAALRVLAGDDELLDDDRQMIADAGFTIEGLDEQSLPDARHDLVVVRRRGAGTDLPANA
jgi:hypothetical protein